MVTLQLALLLLCISGLGKSLHLNRPLQQKDGHKICVQQPNDHEDAGDPLNGIGSVLVDEPPPHAEYARMARYIVHNSNWTAMATTSTRVATKGYPMASVFSMSDGSTTKKSTGIPYFYLTLIDISVHDLNVDKRASITMSLAQGSYCLEHNFDPEDPRCAHIILTGKIIRLIPGSKEEAFARDALFTRHPEMKIFPKVHGWFFAKLDIENIMLLDYFGAVKTVTLDKYFAATPY